MQTVIFNAASQSLVHVPPARVSTATYAIEDLTRADDASDRTIASGSATVASWTVTTSAAAGPDQSNASRMSTATTAGTIGDAATIEDPDGRSEVFTVARISSNAYLESEAPLAGSYASGSTVYGIA
jgi:hypothetical protein